MKSGKLLQGIKVGSFEEKRNLGIDRPDRKVVLVDDNGTDKVLKIFHLQNSEVLMRRFYRQCSLLDSLPSLHFCHIDGFFVDGEKGCLLMPFYPNGDLGHWLENPLHEEETGLKKRFLIDILTGLAVLHERKLVHCDIKPQNIFLTKTYCAIIGDFDGMRHGDMTMTRVQATDKYLCPEFASSKDPDPSMDMWALGVMVEEMFASTTSQDDWMDLVQKLKADDPRTRMSARDAMEHPFLHSERVVEKVFCSVICHDNVKKSDSVSCGKGHYGCTDCIDALVKNWSDPSNDADEDVSCGIPCWHSPSSCTVNRLDSFMHLLSEETLHTYLEAIKRRTEKFHTKPLKERIEELESNATNLEVSKHVKTILHMIAIKCPKNGHAFTDFTGCFALKCAQCSCNFCGWCLEDCGSDAHPHVAKCPKNLNRDIDVFFGQLDQFRRTHNPPRERALLAYWTDVPDALRQQVLQEILPYINIYNLNVNLTS